MNREYEIESSNIEKIGYDPKTKRLVITFKNKTSYAYDNINQATVCKLMFSDSVGREFHDSIKVHKAHKIG